MRKIALTLLIVGCSKQAPPEPAAETDVPPEPQAEAQAEAAAPSHYPGTADARAFVDALTALEVTGLNPTGASEFTYQTMSFDADGTWSAEAQIDVGGETAPCRESGTWVLDEVTDADTATMVWTLTETNCATRNAGDETRLQMDIASDGTYEVSFR